MNKIVILTCFIWCIAQTSFSQEVVYNNAYPNDPTNTDVGLITSTGSGFGGADESVLQLISLGMNILGWGHQVSLGFTLTDDFVIDQDYDLQTIRFYAYQTGSPTTSTITGARVRIWDGDPSAGGTIIWGDLIANVLLSTSFSSIYRVAENTLGTTQRPIMTVEASVPVSLVAGTYWVEWQVDGSLGSGPWAPPITVLGSNTTGNAQQSLDGGVSFADIEDNGTSTGQGFPFIISAATTTQAIPTISEWGIIIISISVLIFGIIAIAQSKYKMA